MINNEPISIIFKSHQINNDYIDEQAKKLLERIKEIEMNKKPNSMIVASDACNIANDYNLKCFDELKDELYGDIKDRSSMGEYYLTVTCINEEVMNLIATHFKALGYSVININTGACKYLEYNSTTINKNTLIISWQCKSIGDED